MKTLTRFLSFKFHQVHRKITAIHVTHKSFKTRLEISESQFITISSALALNKLNFGHFTAYETRRSASSLTNIIKHVERRWDTLKTAQFLHIHRKFLFTFWNANIFRYFHRLVDVSNTPAVADTPMETEDIFADPTETRFILFKSIHLGTYRNEVNDAVTRWKFPLNFKFYNSTSCIRHSDWIHKYPTGHPTARHQRRTRENHPTHRRHQKSRSQFRQTSIPHSL